MGPASPLLSALLLVVTASACAGAATAAARPWQQVSFPGSAAVASAFRNPPPEYSATVTWGWDGPMSEEAIVRDLDALHGAGFRAVTIEAGYEMDNAPYLSDGWFAFVRFAVAEARARGMRVWIIDEGKYPSGFAGGKFSAERPELRMQGIAVAEEVSVAPGTTLARALAPEVLGALAINTRDGSSRAVDIAGGRLDWKAPAEGQWIVRLVDRQYRTPVTRAANDRTRGKTTANSMADLLDPAAVQQFIDWTHEAYARHLGAELGTTVLGFRGDEPEFGHLPYTAGILGLFRERKGYEVQPFLAAFVAPGRGQAALQLTDEQKRARADYWDVWSDLFARNFFTRQAEWCAAHGVEYVVHLNNEHSMPRLVRSTGDFFRPMRHVQVPAVDAIWNQVWPGRVADFVRLPASAAHLYGRPRVLSESFAAYREFPVTVETARWAVNYQMVRGVNLFEFMFYPSSARRGGVVLPGYMGEEGFRGLVEYTNRACHLMAQGRPGATVGLYFPSGSLWLGDSKTDKRVMALVARLQELPRDFDLVDEQALTSVLELDERGRLRNLSGTSYRAILVPEGAAISRAALARLEAFAGAGGKVVAMGAGPSLVYGETFRDAVPAGVSPWMVHEPSGEIAATTLAALPPPDLVLDEASRSIRYVRRRLADGSVWMLFNEGAEAWKGRVTLRGRGQLQVWDPATGAISSTGIVATRGVARIEIELQAGEARFLVLAASAPEVAAH